MTYGTALFTATNVYAGTAPWALGLTLTTSDAGTAGLDSLIAEMSDYFDRLTDDHYETTAGTVTVDSIGGVMLRVPQRVQSITSLATQDYQGTWTTESGTAYRYEAFTGEPRQIQEPDTVWIVEGQTLANGSRCWPAGIQVARIVGTFGWPSCPALDRVRRAVYLLCWDRVKPEGDSVRRATTWTSGGEQYSRGAASQTGIPEVDQIIADLHRVHYLAA